MNIKKLITTAFLMTLVSASFGQDSDATESLIDEIVRLVELLDDGFLNVEEFNAAKRQILGLSSEEGKDNASDTIDSFSETNPAYSFGVRTENYPDGTSYTGGMVDGKRSGFGTYSWADGTSYEGGWRNGLRVGRGVYRYSNGTQQSGNTMNGVWTPESNESSSNESKGSNWTKAWKDLADALNKINDANTPNPQSETLRQQRDIKRQNDEILRELDRQRRQSNMIKQEPSNLFPVPGRDFLGR